MGLTLSNVFKSLFGKKDVRILMVGLGAVPISNLFPAVMLCMCVVFLAVAGALVNFFNFNCPI